MDQTRPEERLPPLDSEFPAGLQRYFRVIARYLDKLAAT